MLGAWREDWIESHQISCNDTGFEVLETYDDGCLSRLHSLDWHHPRLPLQDFVVRVTVLSNSVLLVDNVIPANSRREFRFPCRCRTRLPRSPGLPRGFVLMTTADVEVEFLTFLTSLDQPTLTPFDRRITSTSSKDSIRIGKRRWFRAKLRRQMTIVEVARPHCHGQRAPD